MKKIGKSPNKDNPMELWLQLINSAEEKGRKEGKAEREAEIAENLRRIGMPEEEIQNILDNK